SRHDAVSGVRRVSARLVEDEARELVATFEQGDGRLPDVGHRPPGLADPALEALGEPLLLAFFEVLAEARRELRPGGEREERDALAVADVLRVVSARVAHARDVLAPPEHREHEALEAVARDRLLVGDEEVVRTRDDPDVDRGEVAEG